MRELPAGAYGPAPAAEPGAYPGATPERSFLYRRGKVEIAEGGEDFAAVEARLDQVGGPPVEERVAVLCLGSNANPAQVEHKLADVSGDRALPFARARVRGVRPVYAGHVSRYGAVPATAEAHDGERDLFVAFYTRRQLAAVHRSEHGNYDLVELPALTAWVLRGGRSSRLAGLHAYLARWGVLTRAGGAAVGLEEMGQSELLGWLLAGTGFGEELDVDAYLSGAARHRERVHGGIGEAGLRRSPTLAVGPTVGPDEARRARWLGDG